MSTLYAFDIETVANERAAAYFANKVYEPAANLKDPIKIAQSIEEKKLKDIDKAALHWWTGKVICLSAKSLSSDDAGTFSGSDEKANLLAFFGAIASDARVIGKNGDSFDIPFLVGRCLYYDIGIHDCLRSYRDIQDVDHMFGFSSASDQRSTLANYAFGLGIEGKTSHGAEVAGLYAEERWNEIRQYCAQDVEIVAEMVRRWQKPFVGRV